MPGPGATVRCGRGRHGRFLAVVAVVTAATGAVLRLSAWCSPSLVGSEQWFHHRPRSHGARGRASDVAARGYRVPWIELPPKTGEVQLEQLVPELEDNIRLPKRKRSLRIFRDKTTGNIPRSYLVAPLPPKPLIPMQERLQLAKGKKEVLAVIDDEAASGHIQAADVAASLERVAGFRRGFSVWDVASTPFESLLREAVRSLQPWLPAEERAGPAEIATYFWASAVLAEVARPVQEEVVPVVSEAVLRNAGRMDAEGVAKVLWAAAALSGRAPQFQNMLPGLVGELGRHWDDFGPLDVSRLLAAAAMLEAMEGMRFAADDVLSAIRGLLPRLEAASGEMASPELLENVLGSAATLHLPCVGLRELLPSILARAALQPQDLWPRTVAHAVFAAARLNVTGGGVDDHLGKIRSDARRNGMKGFKLRDLSRLAWGLAARGDRDGPLMDAIAEKVLVQPVPGLQKGMARVLPQLLCGFARLEAWTDASLRMMEKVSDALMQQGKGVIRMPIVKSLYTWDLRALHWAYLQLERYTGGSSTMAADIVGEIERSLSTIQEATWQKQYNRDAKRLKEDDMERRAEDLAERERWVAGDNVLGQVHDLDPMMKSDLYKWDERQKESMLGAPVPVAVWYRDRLRRLQEFQKKRVPRKVLRSDVRDYLDRHAVETFAAEALRAAPKDVQNWVVNDPRPIEDCMHPSRALVTRIKVAMTPKGVEFREKYALERLFRDGLRKKAQEVVGGAK